MARNHPVGGEVRRSGRLLAGVLLAWALAGPSWAAQPDSPDPSTRQTLPILLPLLEGGRLDPERARDLLGAGVEECLREWELVPASPAAGDCIELSSIDRPALPDTFDVLRYDIVVTAVNEGLKSVEATTTLTLEALAGIPGVDLDFFGQEVLSVEVRDESDGAWEPVPGTQRDAILHVGFLAEVDAGDTVRVRIRHAGSDLGCVNIGGIPSGVVFSSVGVHTFSEPAYARLWFPCHDVPWDRALVSVAVAPVAGRVASACGVRVDPLDVNGVLFPRWETPDPIPTYLAAFYLGDYEEWADTTASGIPLEYFTYPDLTQNARIDFANLPDMMEFFSGFHPYPNPRYAMSLGYFGGGMEHQMNSLIGYFFIRGDRSFESLFAHELAHQWWGNLVTMDSWRHIWLNEGFAVYFDLLDTEQRYGWEDMRARIAFTDSVYQARLELLDHPILDPPLNRLFSFTVYQKGGRVLDMLRMVSRMRLMGGPPAAPGSYMEEIAAGDARFFRIFREYAARYAWSNATTDDFREVAEEVLGEDLRWFFAPWLEGEAYPTWQVDWNATPHATGTFLEVQVRQKPGEVTRFEMPVVVRYRSGSRVLDEVRCVGDQPRSWTVSLPPGTWSVELDPEDWLLDAVEPRELIPTLRVPIVFPNPSSTGFTLTAAQEESGSVPVVFSVHDLQGREVRRLDLGRVRPGPLSLRWDGRGTDGTRVAPGVYFGRLTLGHKAAASRLVVIP